MENIANDLGSIWASEEYGRAELGDARRTKRVVEMLGRAMEFRAGKITQVFPTNAERKGAYRLLENDEVLPRRGAGGEADAAVAAAARAGR